MEYDSHKRQICEIGRLMYYNHLAVANDGNISVRVSKTEFLVTPTRICKKDLTPEMILLMDTQGNVLAGNMLPSSEVKMHIKVYEMREDIGAVVHTHSPYATTFATIGRPLDRITVPSAYCFLGQVPIAEYGTASTNELPNQIASHIMKHDVILLKNHGALLAGQRLEETYFKAERLELYAQISVFSELLGGPRELSPDEISRLDAKKERQKEMGLL